MNKKGLGKGLGAIFGDAADPVNTAVEPVRSDEEKKELVKQPHQVILMKQPYYQQWKIQFVIQKTLRNN